MKASKSVVVGVIVGAVVAGVGLAAIVETAQAAPKKRRLAVEQPTRTIYYSPSGRRYIIVQKRSFLDAGTEVLPGERKYHDYAFPPYYSPVPLNTTIHTFSRQPLPGPFDLPGYGGWYWGH